MVIIDFFKFKYFCHKEFSLPLGGAGVGKTFMIKVIAKWIEKILRIAGDNPSKPKLLLLGPTGMSASLIG